MARSLLVALVVGLVSARPCEAAVRQASLDELVALSAVVVRGVVQLVDDGVALTQGGPPRTAIEVRVLEALKGQPGMRLRLELLGGRTAKSSLEVAGMPRFSVGEEIVLLLEAAPAGLAPAGLELGVFRVSREGSRARVHRRLADLVVVGSAPPAAPATLDELLQRLRALAAL